MWSSLSVCPLSQINRQPYIRNLWNMAIVLICFWVWGKRVFMYTLMGNCLASRSYLTFGWHLDTRMSGARIVIIAHGGKAISFDSSSSSLSSSVPLVCNHVEPSVSRSLSSCLPVTHGEFHQQRQSWCLGSFHFFSCLLVLTSSQRTEHCRDVWWCVLSSCYVMSRQFFGIIKNFGIYVGVICHGFSPCVWQAI